MMKMWTKTLVAGGVAGALVLAPMPALASDSDEPPSDGPSKDEMQDDHRQEDGGGSGMTTAEVIGWMLISITSEMVFGPGVLEDAVQESESGSSQQGGSQGSSGGNGGSTQQN